MDRRFKIALGCVAAAAALLLVRAALDGPSDQELIRTAVDEAVAASKEGKPGPVLDFVSRSMTVNAQQVGAERGEIAQFIRQYRPEVEIVEFNPRIQGDEAVLMTPVRLKLRILTAETTQEVPDVTLRFRREAAVRWGIVPASRWRLTDVTADQLPTSAPEGWGAAPPAGF